MGLGTGPADDMTLNSTLSPEQQAIYQHPDVIRRILSEAHTIAVVGLSTSPQKASQLVATYMLYAGYRIVPVHPRAERILDQKVYPTLAEIPFPVDLVNVFRPARETPGIARQAVATISPRDFPGQAGAHDESSERAASGRSGGEAAGDGAADIRPVGQVN